MKSNCHKKVYINNNQRDNSDNNLHLQIKITNKEKILYQFFNNIRKSSHNFNLSKNQHLNRKL